MVYDTGSRVEYDDVMKKNFQNYNLTQRTSALMCRRVTGSNVWHWVCKFYLLVSDKKKDVSCVSVGTPVKKAFPFEYSVGIHEG